MQRDNFLPTAINDLQQFTEKLIRKDSPEWHLAHGLLRIAQGIQQEASILEARLSAIEARISLRQ
jgi:hypothetical protein